MSTDFWPCACNEKIERSTVGSFRDRRWEFTDSCVKCGASHSTVEPWPQVKEPSKFSDINRIVFNLPEKYGTVGSIQCGS